MAEYIEREALNKLIDREIDLCNSGMIRGVLEYLKAIAPLAADVAPVVHGEWETSREIDWDGNLVYDHFHRGCGYTYTNHLEGGTPFCPNCGAKMDGERRDSDG